MRLLRILVFCLIFAVPAFSQSMSSIDISGQKISLGFPSFTDRDQYNSYDFCNSPLGIFEKDSFRVHVDCDFRSDMWHAAGKSDSLQKSYKAWNVPDITLSKPNIAYLRLYYTPTSISDASRGRKLSLPLQRFGLTLAGQAPSGIFQLALQGKGYYGDETAQGNPDTRLIMGLEDLGATIGSRIHELVTIGMEGGATAKLDTLRDPIINDRYFAGEIPVLGWYIEFGKKGFPVASDFSLHIGTHRFVYVVDENGNSINKDPLRGDSLAWKWQGIGEVRQNDFVYSPALFISYWSNHYQPYQPTASNNDLSVGQELVGRDWKFSDMTLGFGASIHYKNILKAHGEYTHSSMALDYGAAWPMLSAKTRGYDRFSVGTETGLNEIPELHFPKFFETFVRIGYFNQRENSALGAFQADEFGLINDMIANSLNYRYSPEFGWGQDQRVIGFYLGAGGNFFNRMIEAETHIGFLSQQSENNFHGMAFGFDVSYNLR
jgi:hypothetical protein